MIISYKYLVTAILDAYQDYNKNISNNRRNSFHQNNLDSEEWETMNLDWLKSHYLLYENIILLHYFIYYFLNTRLIFKLYTLTFK